ncbi:MAG: hypothetical protein ACK5G7_02575 [Erysipelotrichaceae bacterium]
MSNKTTMLSGRNIYYDKKNRAIYYNKRNKTGYVIPQSYEKTYQNLSNRYVIGILTFIFLNILFNFNTWISLAAGISVIIFLEFKYRSALSNMSQLRNFKPSEAKKSTEVFIKDMSTGSLVLRLVLYLLLAILIILNLFYSPYFLENMPIVIACIVVSLGATYLAIKMLISIIKKQKLK